MTCRTLPTEQVDLWIYLQVDGIFGQIMADQAERLGFPLALGRQHRFSHDREAAGDIQQWVTGSGRIGVCLRKQGGFEFMGIVQTPLVQVLIALVVVGVLLWLVNTFIPMAGSIKSILNAVVVIVVVVWLLNIFGLMHYITNFHVNRVG